VRELLAPYDTLICLGAPALANLCSSLKPRGRLLIPLSGPDCESLVVWKAELAAFPGNLRINSYSMGWRGVLTLARLFGRDHRVSVLEFRMLRRQTSRLDWHRIARAAVMDKMNPPAAA
jgi:hypothetical protein